MHARTAVSAPYPGDPGTPEFAANSWWTRIDPTHKTAEFAQLTFVRRGRGKADWIGEIASPDIRTNVSGSPQVYQDAVWHPVNFVKDGDVNVWRPKGLKWQEDPKGLKGGSFVVMKSEDAAADDGGVPSVFQLPRAEPAESRAAWTARCKVKFPQINLRNKDYKALLETAWAGQAA